MSLLEGGESASTVERHRGGESRPTVLPYIDRLRDRADGAYILETKDWITVATSGVALGVAIWSLLLSLARDRREVAAKQPTCEVFFERRGDKVLGDVLLRVTNNGATTLTLQHVEVTRRGGKTEAMFPVTGQPFLIGLDMARASMRYELDRARVPPSEVFEKIIQMRLVSLDKGDTQGDPASFEVLMNMGGADDQPRRFKVTRMLID